MRMPAGFEVLCDADIEVGVRVGCCGLINDIPLLAFAIERAFIPFRSLAVACLSCVILFVFAEDFAVV